MKYFLQYAPFIPDNYAEKFENGICADMTVFNAVQQILMTAFRYVE